MAKYAATTSVTVEKSQAEIIQILKRFGIKEFGSAVLNEGTSIWFKNGGILFNLGVKHDPQKDTAQEQRRKWRALVLVTKAKLVAASDGITTIEREFMPFIVTDNGQLFADRFLPAIHEEAKAMGGRVSGQVLALPGVR